MVVRKHSRCSLNRLLQPHAPSHCGVVLAEEIGPGARGRGGAAWGQAEERCTAGKVLWVHTHHTVSRLSVAGEYYAPAATADRAAHTDGDYGQHSCRVGQGTATDAVALRESHHGLGFMQTLNP